MWTAQKEFDAAVEAAARLKEKLDVASTEESYALLRRLGELEVKFDASCDILMRTLVFITFSVGWG